MTIIGKTFDELVNKSDQEVMDEARQLAKRQMQRKIASAYDDAYSNAMRLKHSIATMFDEFRTRPANAANKFEINALLTMRRDQREYERARDDCATLYQELFGESIPGIDA